jgi:hypothetical protein
VTLIELKLDPHAVLAHLRAREARRWAARGPEPPVRGLVLRQPATVDVVWDTVAR